MSAIRLTLSERRCFVPVALLTALVFMLLPQVHAQGLQITYGAKGLQTLSFQSLRLEDVGANPADVFHIWHMKATDLQGRPISDPQVGWGENNNGESWNASTQTETYTFWWGGISTQFVQHSDNLDMIVTETNNSGSGILFDGAEIFPLAMHFPAEPVNFAGYTQFLITSTGPGVSVADYGSGVVTAVLPDESVTMFTGWKSAGRQTYTPIMTSTTPDGVPTFFPRHDLPVLPGNSFSYTVSLRFTPEGSPVKAADAYSSFAATYPSQMTWTDKRIIGTAYLASSPENTGDITQPGGFPTNPRRYFNDPTVDVTTSAGLQAFQRRILAQAATNATNALAMNGQGVITWDIEGEEYPQATSYVCSPDQIASVAPEMESVIMDPDSPYRGRKLDDAYFQIMSSAGLRNGMCLRPQAFTPASGRTASQVYLPTNAAIIANLENKAKYANARWGATIFYVDSTVDTNGGTLDPAIFQQLITDFPSFLFIPEESTPRYYAYSAPFYSFIFHTTVGTPASTYSFYPKAFGANLINDVSASTLASYQGQLTQAVASGDILMGLADYWQANDPTLVSIYQASGVPATPPQVTPVLSWPAPASISFGTPLSASQLNASASALGQFVYTPALGTTLQAGVDTLLATFTPMDTEDYKSVTASVMLTITPAVPQLTWPSPAPIVEGKSLTAAQLNATASVPGNFIYEPGLGTKPAFGTNILQVTFQPADSVNYTAVTARTNLTVTQPLLTPTVRWKTPAAITYGTALSALQLDATANVAGTFAYTPPAGTVLKAGSYTLATSFKPSDTAYTNASATVSLRVKPAVPTVLWASPADFAAGTALTASQLNATANTPGAFTYNPAPGSVLIPGKHILSVTFTPTDDSNYTSTTETVVVRVITAKAR